VRPVHGHCERARQWASLEPDGELSSFERALLDAHVADCASCGQFRAEIGGLTGALRSAPHEPFEGVVIGRARRRASMRLAPAAAAMAVAAVGLGSILSSSAFRSGGVGRIAVQNIDVTPATASAATAPDTMNLATSKARARLSSRPAGRLAAGANGTLTGGPVVSQR
jgi:predicted anti-sigma-YlaC factor YlaD